MWWSIKGRVSRKGETIDIVCSSIEAKFVSSTPIYWWGTKKSLLWIDSPLYKSFVLLLMLISLLLMLLATLFQNACLSYIKFALEKKSEKELTECIALSSSWVNKAVLNLNWIEIWFRLEIGGFLIFLTFRSVEVLRRGSKFKKMIESQLDFYMLNGSSPGWPLKIKKQRWHLYWYETREKYYILGVLQDAGVGRPKFHCSTILIWVLLSNVIIIIHIVTCAILECRCICPRGR